MLIDALSYPLAACPELEPFWARLDAGEDAALGIAQSARPFMVAARFSRVPQPTCVVVATEEAATDFARHLATYVGEARVLRFPARSDFPWASQGAQATEIAQRAHCLHALATGADVCVVASSAALLRTLPPHTATSFAPLHIVADAPVKGAHETVATFDDLLRTLESFGYENTVDLEGPGTYCVQGGSIDVFAGNMAYPVRLDFFGDECDGIRRIVPSTGQTIAQLASVDIYPVREVMPSKRAIARAKDKLYNPAKTNPVLRELLDKLEGGVVQHQTGALLPYLYETPETLGNYLGPDVLTVLIEPRSLIDDALRTYDDLLSRSAGTSVPLDGLYVAPAKLDFGSNQRATYQSIMSIGATVDAEMPVKRTDVAGDPEKLFGKLRSFVDAGYVTVFSAPNLRSREEMKLEMVDRGLPIVEVLECASIAAPNTSSNTAPAALSNAEPNMASLAVAENTSTPAQSAFRLRTGVVNVTDVDVPLGMVLPKAKLALVAIADTQGAGALKAGKRVDITEITFPYAPGDYVVHAAHGVAFFRDVVRQEVGDTARDYLLLEYAQDDKLYVPVEQLDRVTRYVGPEGASPRLTRLNTSDWSRALTRARKASKKLAFDLVDVYARRAAAKGYQYGPDTPWQTQMEDDFPYQETPDQLAAIADVKADMQSARPMDRLVCGDVGFGKTEVALRAAFKACQDNKQVMVLCPTTILAQQHYSTFGDRFAPYGVQVEVLSRFRTPAQQRSALEGFAAGSVDVLVGTHRLLSRDVNPHDLGLVVIDEEQRFGVGHKEQLKNLRESVDVLTLSATPIPRTMQMSLSGVRDMSLILTPPDERRPVEVHVGEWDPDIVSGAIARELDRGGQVYYVSNRVRSIEDAVARVEAAAPGARIAVAHGKMGKDELERVMEDFSAGVVDVLVATTIIESGIDNPHTNTLVIEDAQRLGLAQMYQLKGRVGRSARQAYAYFMFPEQVSLTEEAMARLTAINEHQDLGSGMRIAMRDLEIRGAGSLLGAEQSGNMSAVGFDLFAQMLATAVNEARVGTAEHSDLMPPALSDITINVPGHSYIDEEYVKDGQERVLLYRRMAVADTVAEVDRLHEQTTTIHGAMPAATATFFAKARLKALANQMHVSTIAVVAGKVNIEPIAQPEGDAWADLRRMKARYVSASRKLMVPLKYFALPEDGNPVEAIFALLELLQGERA